MQIRKPIRDSLDPEEFYRDATSARHRKHGSIFIDGKNVADTIQCVHCNKHFTHRKSRGDYVCLNCMGPVCGQWACVHECTPFEQKLDQYERGERGILR